MARKTDKGGKFRNVHCRTRNIARKLKIMENENHPLDNLLTRNAVYDAKRILGITDTKRATAADEGDAAQDAAPPATPEEAPPPELPTAADGQALFPLA